MDKSTRLDKEDSKVNFNPLVAQFKRFWWVYGIVFILFMGLAFVYIKLKAPVYEADATVILNDDDNDGSGTIGGLGSLMATFSLGNAGYKYVEDEMMRMTSHSNLTQVVKELGLNEVYRGKYEFFTSKETYFGNSPVQVYIPEAVLDTIGATSTFKISVSPDGKTASVKVKQMGKKVFSGSDLPLPAMVKTPLGTFRVSTTRYFKPGKHLNITAVLSNPGTAAEELAKDISVSCPSKKSSLVFLTYEDPSRKRGMAILNTLIAIYNEKSLIDYKDQASASLKFVDERLVKLYSELESSEDKIEKYKQANNIVDASAEAEYIFKKKQVVETGVIEYETKASVLRMIIDFLHNESNRYALIPFSADMPEDPVTEYNTLVLERMRLLANAKGNNATLKMVTQQIDAMRGNLLVSLDKQLSATRLAIADMNKVSAGSDSRIAGYPTMEKDLLQLYRDQKIKNQIYAFLLQKREENELKLSRDVNRGKIVDEAYTLAKPVKPVKPLVYIAAAIASVGCTYVGLWLLMFVGKWLKRRREQKDQAMA